MKKKVTVKREENDYGKKLKMKVAAKAKQRIGRRYGYTNKRK
jgi:hypothetical protein